MTPTWLVDLKLVCGTKGPHEYPGSSWPRGRGDDEQTGFDAQIDRIFIGLASVSFWFEPWF